MLGVLGSRGGALPAFIIQLTSKEGEKPRFVFGYKNGGMNKFESILFDYGRYVFVSVFRKAQEEERYEDCAVMRDIMQKYHIPCDTSLEDWRTDLWRFGYSGDVAINNLSVYMVEALTRAGYSNS
jgi:hypothetical protein